MKIWEIDVQCQSCNGTGIYVGIAERDGAGVICNTCNGTGKQHYTFKYEKFTGLQKRNDVKRVYKQSYGYVLSPKEIDFDDVGLIDLTQEGVSYDDFLKGEMPKHIKTLACPMIADQGTCHNIKGFVDICNDLGSIWGRSIYLCKNQKNKADCWKRFDKGKENEH